MLLECVCQSPKTDPWGVKEDVQLVRCARCGVGRVREIDAEAYREMYTSGYYHTEIARRAGYVPWSQRYEHDRHVALFRLRPIKKLRPPEAILLDVGCANGAFVIEALADGYDAWGCDLFLGALPESNRGIRFFEGSVDACPSLLRGKVDVLTMHDVLEHCLDPVDMLRFARAVLKPDGLLVIDLPDIGCEAARKEGLAFKHVKPVEHLWYFTAEQLMDLLYRRYWQVSPPVFSIPGRVTLYCHPERVEREVTVRVPPGIGDIHWCATKLEAIREQEEPCRLTLLISQLGSAESAKVERRAEGYGRLMPFVDDVRFEAFPFALDQGKFDDDPPSYMLFPNPHLEQGKRLETWRPEWRTNFDYALFAPAPEAAWAKRLEEKAGGRIFAFYLASMMYNDNGFNDGSWTTQDWARVLEAVRLTYHVKPVLLGSPWDSDYASMLWQHVREEDYYNLIGQTTVAQMFAVLRKARVVVGVISGLPMMAVHFRTPTVTLWPQKGVTRCNPRSQFLKTFQTNWVSDDRMRHYLPLAFGQATPRMVLEAVHEFSGSGIRFQEAARG